MPFVKKTGTKDALHSIDAHRIFIGRTNEVQFFREYILSPEDPAYNIVSIDGQGGVGKSTLLLRFMDDTGATDFKDYCLTALVNERQTTPASIMEKFADQLNLEGDFERALKQYKEVLHKLQKQRDAARETLARKATTEIIDSVSKDVPFIGGILKEGAEVATNYIFEELHYRQLLKDAERMEDPIGDLTRAFITELNRITETSVTVSSTRAKRQRRVILFFDTFEQLASEVAPWLLDYFLEANVNSNVVLVIAGRDPLDRSTPDDPKRWLPYYDNRTIYSISLNSFTKEETGNYLNERGITNPERINMIWQLSRGLPLYLGFLTADPQGKVDPTANVVANFLRWIPEQEHIKRRLALDAALFSRPFNQDDLEAFTYISKQEHSNLYRWLTIQPFVHSNLQDGRYGYHELAQELFSRHLYQLSPSEYYATRVVLAEHYRRLLRDIESAYDSPQWLELTLALAKQLFLLPENANHIKAIEQVFNALIQTEQMGAREIERMLRELSIEQFHSPINASARQIAKHLLYCIEDDEEDEEFLIAINYLMAKVIQEPSSPAALIALLYSARGYAHYSLKEYDKALADHNQAIEINPSAIAYDNRGDFYRDLKQYELALADYGRAIELSPEKASYYNRRGNVYYDLEQYELALADYGRAIELDSNDALYYSNRANVYRDLKQYELALADYGRAIELSPEKVSYYNRRGNVYYDLEQYELALADYGRAIELSPNVSVFCSNRGALYYDLGQNELALIDYTRAIELNPEKATYYNRRGNIYWDLKQYELALADYGRAIELSPNVSVFYSNRGGTHYDLGQNELALADYSRAIELNPNSARFYNRRGNVYYLLKQYEEALVDYSRAIELDSGVAMYYDDRGDIYYALERYEEAVTDYNRAIELNPEVTRYYDNRGMAYFQLKKYEEALTDYDRAINLNPDNAGFYNQRGDIYYRLEKNEEALADYSRAIELRPNISMFYSHRAQVYRDLEQHELALADASRAIELNPEQDSYYNRRGNVYRDLKQYELALADYSRAIELNPKVSVFYSNRGGMYYNLEQNGLALADYSRAIELSPVNASYYSRRGNVYSNLERDELALSDYSRAIELDPNNAGFYYDRARVYQQLKKYEEALADYSRAIELYSDSAMFYGFRCLVYHVLERYEEALADINRAIGLDPEFAGFYGTQGDVYLKLKKYEEALAAYNQAIELEPEDAALYDDRGDSYYRLESYEEALADYSRAINLDPNDARLYYRRGNLYKVLRRYEEALADYNRAIELDPKMSGIYPRRGLIYLSLKNIKQAIADYTYSWELNQTNVYGGWMTEWSRMCLEVIGREMIQRLEAIIAVEPECYAARVSRGVISWFDEYFEQAKMEIEQAIPLKQQPWEAYFWLGIVEVSLRRDEIAIATLEKALEKGLPPVLLAPLRWFSQKRPDFYENYIVSLFARYELKT